MLKSTILAVTSSPTFNTSAGFSICSLELFIEPRQRAFIDLVVLGWKPEDALQICGINDPSDSPYKIRTQANDILNNIQNTVSYYKRMQGIPMPSLAPEQKREDLIKEGEPELQDEFAEDLDPNFNGNYSVSDDDLSLETSKDYQLKEWIIAKRKYKIVFPIE